MKQTTFAKRQHGIGLIEVVVALLVFSIAVLGFAGLQARALTQNNDANFRVAAVLIAQDAVERMMINPEADYTGGTWPAGTLGAAPATTCITGACDSDALATWDRGNLAWQAANYLPSGRVMVEQCKFNTGMNCVIVSWEEQAPGACTTNSGVNTASDSKCFVLEVVR